MNDPTLIISPKTKVGQLLDAYPELEYLLTELSPAFAKLKNPILRKTVARVTTLQQAAVVGGLKVDELVNRLRKETGQADYEGNIDDTAQLTNIPPPPWYDESGISIRFNAIPIINAGNSPMNDILKLVHNLKMGEILELRTPFVPAPIIDMLKSKGSLVFSTKKGDEVFTYIRQDK